LKKEDARRPILHKEVAPIKKRKRNSTKKSRIKGGGVGSPIWRINLGGIAKGSKPLKKGQGRIALGGGETEDFGSLLRECHLRKGEKIGEGKRRESANKGGGEKDDMI